MELNEYQQQAMTTRMDTCNNVGYMFFNLMGEVGELSSKIAKQIRKGNLSVENSRLHYNQDWDVADLSIFQNGIAGELGDILWQWAGLCDVLGFRADTIAKENLQKLASRQERGVIDSNGDFR